MAEVATIDAAEVLKHLYAGEFDFNLRVVRGLGYVPTLDGRSSVDAAVPTTYGSLEEAVAWLGERALAQRATRMVVGRWELEMVQLLGGG